MEAGKADFLLAFEKRFPVINPSPVRVDSASGIRIVIDDETQI
jgi:hypothetical protein